MMRVDGPPVADTFNVARRDQIGVANSVCTRDVS
jgi:hypothetical protein